MNGRRGQLSVAEQLLHVTNAECADAYALEYASLLHVDDGFPSLATRLGSTPWTVDQVEVDVSQAALVKRLLNGPLGGSIAGVVLQLRCVKDVFATSAGGLAEVKDSASALAFILIPFGRVL